MRRRIPEGEAADDPAAPLALAVARAADDRKAVDVRALRVGHLTSATSFFVNMVGRSKAQINAIVKSIEEVVEDEFGRAPHRQGKALGGWVCLDFDSVVVNVFSEAQRDFYSLDKFWAAGQELDLSGVLTPNAPEELSAATDVDADVDDWELDDWDLEDWTGDVDDGQWSAGVGGDDGGSAATHGALGTREEAAGATDAVARSTATLGGDADDADDLFAGFTSEVVEESPVEAVIVAAEDEVTDEELIEAGLLESTDEDEGDDWALGDEQLRELVQRAERGASEAVAEGERAGSAAGGWRAMMEEDGLSVEEGADILAFEEAGEGDSVRGDDDDDDDRDLRYFT